VILRGGKQARERGGILKRKKGLQGVINIPLLLAMKANTQLDVGIGER
jgi:hypothetical protein